MAEKKKTVAKERTPNSGFMKRKALLMTGPGLWEHRDQIIIHINTRKNKDAENSLRG